MLKLFLPLRSNYYEIAILGDEYCVRTPGREWEAQRVPRTLGGVMLLISSIDRLNTECGLFIARGGRSGF
ncbi:hypothetical protein pEaSNUABM29_00020 [Erwinia phage pEa_SNUABM_29]|nr:hypothetical protein pEaSNUABM29_00020 [Erwinia phage pEa_SNUABM_29]